jgi:hypothetical protein
MTNTKRAHLRCIGNGICSSSDPYVIWPWYTGRDKGALCERLDPAEGKGTHGDLLLFYGPGHAWHHIFTHVQPNDSRARDNFRVVKLSEYHAAV